MPKHDDAAAWEAITPDMLNANEGTERGDSMLDESIDNLGWGSAGTLDADYNIIGSNKSLMKAMAKGYRLRIVDVEPGEAVAIRRRDLHLYAKDDPRGRDLATALNRVPEVNLSWADTMLQAAETHQGAKARDTFWYPNERTGLTTAEAKKAAKEADAADAEQQPLDVKPRQVPRFRQVYVVTCKGEDDAADLTDWLEERGIAWREA